MAGNDWINSYLEAILDVGPGIADDKAKSSLLLRERGRFSPTRYFVEEVITGFDETDLHRSWIRVRSLYHSLPLPFKHPVHMHIQISCAIKICLALSSILILELIYLFISIQAASMRRTEERNTRLENMCWRIWNLARKKKQVLLSSLFIAYNLAFIFFIPYLCVCSQQ